MRGELGTNHGAKQEQVDAAGPPIEDLFDFDEDPVDYTSAASFPASDPPPPQSMMGQPEPL